MSAQADLDDPLVIPRIHADNTALSLGGKLIGKICNHQIVSSGLITGSSIYGRFSKFVGAPILSL